MNIIKDQSGSIFGQLLALMPLSINKRIHYLCLCNCGESKVIRFDVLKNGVTKSCGCYKKELNKKPRKHGYASHFSERPKAYNSWMAMKRRVLYKFDKDYKNYGARGIKICNEWLDFGNFYKDMGDKPIGKSLDRIDNNGNYEPKNCKWSSAKEQANNRKRI